MADDNETTYPNMDKPIRDPKKDLEQEKRDQAIMDKLYKKFSDDKYINRKTQRR
jgi:hypothetical protein